MAKIKVECRKLKYLNYRNHKSSPCDNKISGYLMALPRIWMIEIKHCVSFPINRLINLYYSTFLNLMLFKCVVRYQNLRPCNTFG
jgi:hypothetical protein